MDSVSMVIDPFFWEGWFSARSGAVLHSLVVDVVTMAVITFGIYYRRHRRSDLVLAYMALNIGLFTVGVLVVNQAAVGVGFGFGLFAILSIVRLRSDQVAHQEVAYYVISLVVGLLNGMSFQDRWLVNLLNVAVAVLMLLLDNGVVLPNSQRMLVTLDTVHATEDDLRADLECRMNCKVLVVIVQQVDYVRETMMLDVRLRPLPTGKALPHRGNGQRVAEARAVESPTTLESL